MQQRTVIPHSEQLAKQAALDTGSQLALIKTVQKMNKSSNPLELSGFFTKHITYKQSCPQIL